MVTHDPITVKRDCQAIQIPYGNTVAVREGTQVTVMQQLGDTFTVRTDAGYLVRIANDDADAIGLTPKDVTPAASDIPHTGPLDEAVLWERLKTCYDPEIPANIVDLGLIYSVVTHPLDAGGNRVDVQMTLTAPGCDMGQVIKDDVERKLSEVAGVSEVSVELVFQPPWEPSMMTEAARLQLGMM